MNKQCRKCGVTYPATTEHFYRVRKYLAHICKPCKRAYQRELGRLDSGAKRKPRVLKNEARYQARFGKAIEQWKAEKARYGLK